MLSSQNKPILVMNPLVITNSWRALEIALLVQDVDTERHKEDAYQLAEIKCFAE